MAAAVIQRSDASEGALTTFSNVASFKDLAHPKLHQDITLNTLVLSQLLELEAAGSSGEGVLLAVLRKCSECADNTDTVLICPGQQGIGCTLYVSSFPICPHTAQQTAQQLHSHPCINRFTTTAANAAQILAALPGHSWQVAHSMDLMVYQPHRQTELDCNPRNLELQLDANHLQPKLEACSPSSPEHLTLTLKWCSEFLTQVFHLKTPPPLEQVQAMALPRFQKGLYHVLRAGPDNQAVCMAGHVPTSDNSTRITMLYTPQEHRGKGYGRLAVKELCRVLQQQGYTDVCLLADRDAPGLSRLYQACGFVAVCEFQVVAKQEAAA